MPTECRAPKFLGSPGRGLSEVAVELLAFVKNKDLLRFGEVTTSKGLICCFHLHFRLNRCLCRFNLRLNLNRCRCRFHLRLKKCRYRLLRSWIARGAAILDADESRGQPSLRTKFDKQDIHASPFQQWGEIRWVLIPLRNKNALFVVSCFYSSDPRLRG